MEKLSEQQTQSCCGKRIGTCSDCSWRFLQYLAPLCFALVSAKGAFEKDQLPRPYPWLVVCPSSLAHVPVLCLSEAPVKGDGELQQLVYCTGSDLVMQECMVHLIQTDEAAFHRGSEGVAHFILREG